MRRTQLVALAGFVSLIAACGQPEATPGQTGTGPTPTTATATSAATTSPATLTAELGITVWATPGTNPRTVSLTCNPAGGNHPKPAQACAQLAAAGVKAFAPVSPKVLCTAQYGGPATATVIGTVNGAPVTAKFKQTDGCEISRWNALAELLGSKAAN